MRPEPFSVLAVIVASFAVLLGMLKPSPLAYGSDVDHATHALVSVFGPIALVPLGLLAVRSVPSVDVRSIESTLVFGPLTLLRPLIVVAGGAWILAGEGRPDVRLLTALACLGMLAVEPVARRLA